MRFDMILACKEKKSNLTKIRNIKKYVFRNFKKLVMQLGRKKMVTNLLLSTFTNFVSLAKISINKFEFNVILYPSFKKLVM